MEPHDLLPADGDGDRDTFGTWPAPESASIPPSPDWNEHGEVTADLPCKHCGYLLRGLNINGRCPECGTSIGWTIQGNFLRYSDPAWVETLSRGSMWMIVSVLLSIFFGCLGGAITQEMDAEFIMTILDLLASGIGLIGVWLITTPELARLKDSPETARGIARYGAVVSFGFQIMTLLAVGFPTSRVLYGIVMIASSIASLMSFFALFIYARSIALRIPNESLARQTTIVMWGTAVGLGLMLFAAIGVVVEGAEPAVICACISLVVLLVFGIWGIVLLFMYRVALEGASKLARETWASAIVRHYSGPF